MISRKYANWILPIVGTAVIFGLWHVVAKMEVLPAVIFPTPGEVVNRFLELQDLIIMNLWPTLTSAMVGFVMAIVLAVSSALLLSANDRVYEAFMPLVVSGNSVPRVSLAPVLIFYFGNFQAKYLLAAWIAFFPMLINTLEGINEIDNDLEFLLDSLNATTWQEYRIVRLPNALPLIFDGLKISVILAIVGAVVAEFVAANEGIGYLALFAIGNYDISLVFALIGLMGIVAVGAFFSIFLVQDRLIHWRQSELFTE